MRSTVTVSGLASYSHLMAVREYLEVRLDGVLGVTQRQFTRGTADLLVDYIGNSMMLADALARQRFQGFRLEPTNVTPSKLGPEGDPKPLDSDANITGNSISIRKSLVRIFLKR